MPKLQVFEVVLEGDNVEVYRPGDWVKGYVRILLAAPKKDIRGIYIKFQGKAKTRWHESQGSGRSRSTVTYSSKEVYFEETLVIFGGDKDRKKLELEPGDHRFPFRFYIPAAPLPLPFESRFGYIRYKLKATIDRPWRFNHDTKRMFSIKGVELDLNRMRPTLGMPHKAGNVKTTCCFCCESKPINIVVQINKAGFVPGELIWVHASVDNRTRRDILSIRAKLKHRIIVTGQRHGIGDYIRTKDWTELIAYVDWGGCRAHRSVVDRRPLRIPPCPASALLGCNIIKVEYILEFIADVKGTPFDAKIILPIIIGTIPLRSAYAVPRASREVVTQQPSASSAMLPPPPPSYEIAVGGLHEIRSKSGYDYTFGKLMYAPRYPFYNLHAPRMKTLEMQDYTPLIRGAQASTPTQGVVVDLPGGQDDSERRSPHLELMLDSPDSQDVPQTTQPSSLYAQEELRRKRREIHEDTYETCGEPKLVMTQREAGLSCRDDSSESDSPIHSPIPTEDMLNSPSTPGLPPKIFKQIDSSYNHGEVPESWTRAELHSPYGQDVGPPVVSTQPFSQYSQHGASSTSSPEMMSSPYAQQGSQGQPPTQGMMTQYIPEIMTIHPIQNEPREDSIEPGNIVVSIEHHPDASYN